jgi:hypothetical protein
MSPETQNTTRADGGFFRGWQPRPDPAILSVSVPPLPGDDEDSRNVPRRASSQSSGHACSLRRTWPTAGGPQGRLALVRAHDGLVVHSEVALPVGSASWPALGSPADGRVDDDLSVDSIALLRAGARRRRARALPQITGTASRPSCSGGWLSGTAQCRDEPAGAQECEVVIGPGAGCSPARLLAQVSARCQSPAHVRRLRPALRRGG